MYVMNEAVQFFKDQFTRENQNNSFSLIDLVPSLITNEDDDVLTQEPIVEEIKKSMFKLNGSSVTGPDGLTVFSIKCAGILLRKM